MVKTTTSTSSMSPAVLCVVDHRVALSGTWTAYGLEAARVLAPRSAAIQGTAVSSAMRERSAAPDQVAATPNATALLPISDVVVFDGLAGIRSWSPPV
jgi:hypothetical protein